MDMFDKDNELSMLIIKQFATEDKCNHYFWLHIMHGVIKGTYKNFSTAILQTGSIAGCTYEEYKKLRQAFVHVYKSVFKYCNEAKKKTDKPVPVDWLREQYIKHLREQYGDVK